METKKIKQAIIDKKDELIALTKDLIRFESISGKEDEISEYIQDFFKEINFYVRSIDKNVLASEKKGNKDARLILNGHMDVVPAENFSWDYPPFDPQIIDEKIYGRGSCDMKGGLASMMFAIKILHELGIDMGSDILFTATVEEETGGVNGTGKIVGSLNGEMCVIAEPTDLGICIGHKGSNIYEITVKGRSAHGSMPQLGKNAIYYAARMIIALEDFKFSIEDDLLGQPTMNVGKISGGTRVNVVPDRCVFELDRRTIPEETSKSVLDELNRIVNREKANGVEAEIKNIIEMLPVKVSTNEKIVRLLKKSTKDVFGYERDITTMDGCTDARFFIDKNIPTVIFGPGKKDCAHVSNEFIEINDLVYASSSFASLITEVVKNNKKN